SLEQGRERRALEPGDRRRGRDLLRTALGAAHMGVTGVATGITGHRSETLCARPVAHVVHQGPGAIERRRPEVARIPAHHVARGVAHAAADTLDAGVDLLALLRLRLHAREIVAARCGRPELPLRLRPLVEEWG